MLGLPAESLEKRVLLAATLSSTGLTIDASNASANGGVVIVVGLNKRFVNIATVWENDQDIGDYSVSAFKHIHIITAGGDDKIWIDSALNPLNYSTVIETGDGNDMITTGDGNDVIDAGEGDDKIYANGGDDVIVGRGGRDSIWAGAGNDSVDGGLGNDHVNGEDGNDSIQGGAGNDILIGEAGNDLINDLGGVDSIAAGDGDDSGVISGSGVVAAGNGNDYFSAKSDAQLFGEGGNDKLYGSRADGGAGDDSIYGTSGADELHGGDGNDLIFGNAGDDSLIGDAGDDALYGGVGNDKIDGGDGNDNLYGSEGYGDAATKADGNDTAFGDAGSDWFETNYQWGRTDRNKTDAPVNQQNDLSIDPSVGAYTNGNFYGVTVSANNTIGGTGLFSSGSGTLTLNSGLTSGLNVTSGALFTGGTLINGNTVLTVRLTGGASFATSVQTKSIGAAGWLSSGAYDPTSKTFVPPGMSHTDRLAVGLVALKLPAGWNLGAMTAARDDVIWYQIYQSKVQPPTTQVVPLNGGGLDFGDSLPIGTVFQVKSNSKVITGGITFDLTPGNYVWNGTKFLTSDASSGEPSYLVTTLAGDVVSVKQSTPHLYDGVEKGTYRFLAVKRGTIIMTGKGSDVTDPSYQAINSPVLAFPAVTYLQIAGSTAVYPVASSFDSLPVGGPKKLRGIAVVGGAIWLPVDGTAPYFSSGR